MTNVVFAGSPAFAAEILSQLCDSPFAPTLVLTQPDRPRGRGRKVAPNAVKQLAQAKEIPTWQPQTLRDPVAAERLKEAAPDVMVVAAYGLILPEAILSVPRYGCINVHASLLPRWRGAAPIERAIMAGDSETGVAIMQMEAGLDTGPVFREARLPISATTTAPVLESALAELGGKLVQKVLADLPVEPTPQSTDGVTYAHKLTRADRDIDWQNAAPSLALQVRGLADRMPVIVASEQVTMQILEAVAEPGATGTTVTPGTLISAARDGLRFQCGEGVLVVTALKISKGKGQVMTAAAALNGHASLFQSGSEFGSVQRED